jgi:predicted alpha/beta hydrolase family esterase
MKAIFLHGTGASPKHNWFLGVASELEGHQWQTWVPQLPDPGHPSSREWTEYVLANTPFAIDDETVIIGHSSGGVAALVLAQTVQTPVNATFVVAAPRDNEYLKWQANDRLFDVPFNFEAIRVGAGSLIFIHSDNDPYCPLEQTRELCERAGGTMVMIPGQGHFNIETGDAYRQFPRLLEIIGEKVGL